MLEPHTSSRLVRPLVGVALGLVFGVLGGLGDSVRGQSANDRAVSFDVTFTANFVQDVLASGETLPADTTFGSVALAMHGSSVSFFEEGKPASPGLKAFAETESTNLLVAEFAASRETASTYSANSTSTDATFPQAADEEQTFPSNQATRKRSNLTFVASFSESPDWFVGARNIELRPGGVWIEELTVDLHAWDAGTDNGADFDSADAPTSPAGNVTSLQGGGKFSDTAIGTLTITMRAPPSNDADRKVVRADAGSLDGALNVFWWAVDGLDTVDFDRYVVAWKSGAEEFQTALDGDRVKVVMGRSSDRVILEGLTNGTEYTVRVTHANAVGPAVHHSTEATATPAERVRELVSNISQNPGRPTLVTFSHRTGLAATFGVVPFTTGPAADTLGSITFLRFQPLTVGGYPRSPDLELHLLEDDGGAPGAPLGTFVQPPEYVDGPTKFVAPGDGFALSASTDYWLKLVLIKGELNTFVARHGDEDPTGQPGWLLGRDCWTSTTDSWPYPIFCSIGTDVSHGPFLMSLNSPIESTLPRASIAGGSGVEGASITFTVELSRAPGAGATVQYSTVDGSGALPATSADGDYTPVTNGTITFGANETSKTVSIATGDDSDDETNERFLVRLSSPSSNIALSERDAAAGVILNNDQTTASDSTLAGITVTDQDGNAIALNETFDRYRFAYMADAPGSVDALNLNVSFDSGVSPYVLRHFDAIGKVKEGKKAVASSAEFTRVAPGPNLLKVQITSNNRRQESLYEVVVTKAASSDATISDFLFEDDARADIALSPAFNSSVTEYTATVGGPGPFYIEATPNHAGAEPRITLNGRTIVSSGASFQDETAHVTFDLMGGENTLLIEFTAEDGTTRTYTFTLTRALEVEFGAGPFSVSEGSSVSLPVILDHDPLTALTIPLTATNQRGATASDYSLPSSVEFMAGETRQSVELVASRDSVTDAGERVELGFGTLPAYVSAVAPTTAVVDIQDVAPSLRVVNFERASYSVAEGGTVTVTVTLDSPASATVAIPLTVTNEGGATSADYSAVPANVTIASGADEGSFTFSAIDDSAVDPGESVRIGLGTLPTGYTEGTRDETVVSITDNDEVPQVAVSFTSATYTVPEGESATVEVVLDRDPGRRVEVTLTVTPVDAGGADYEVGWPDASNLGRLVFDAGVTARTFTFHSLTDDEEDDGETVTIEIDEPSAARVALGAPSETTVTIDARPSSRFGGGLGALVGLGGGGGGPTGPEPSEEDFEWTVKRDIEALDDANGAPTGAWSNGTTLWVADNPNGAGDAVYAYDLATGERLEEQEFELAETNRAPRGAWSDRETIWVSDSGQDRLFAYDLATGERLEEREIALTRRNDDPRGIWSDGETMWVLDDRRNALFAYDLKTGEFIAEYALDASNGQPHGIWSDGVTLWVSDHGAKRLFAYVLPVPANDVGEEDLALERVPDEDFVEPGRVGNNSPRGIWSDGEVMYVADANDGKVYSYNMPDAIDARLASLSLSGVDIGEFDPGQTDYEGVPGEGVTETTVEAEAVQAGATVVIEPSDADEGVEGHQVALAGLDAVTVTVTSADGSRERVYRVALPEAAPPAPCLRGAVSVGFSLVVYEGGSVDDLVRCARSRHVTALYALHEGEYVPYILGAPEFVNGPFLELYPDGVAALTVLTVSSDGPATAAPPAPPVTEPFAACLRGEITEGFSLVLYEGGSVEDLVGCAEGRNATALYALVDGEYVAYILGAPEFVNRPFFELYADGVPALTPLVVRGE